MRIWEFIAIYLRSIPTWVSRFLTDSQTSIAYEGKLFHLFLNPLSLSVSLKFVEKMEKHAWTTYATQTLAWHARQVKHKFTNSYY